MNQQKIGALLKQLRREKEMTQEQLAEQFGVSARTISRWETGSNMPDIGMLIELADFFDVDIRELIDGERKSENMNEEVKDTIQKVAEYADEEKTTLMKRARVLSIVGLSSMILGFVMELLSADYGIELPLYSWAEGCCFGLALGTLVGMVLYTTGVLARIRQKKMGKRTAKILLAASIAVIAISMLAAIIASLKGA